MLSALNGAGQDDLDDIDIAAFSQDMEEKADSYTTLSQQEEQKIKKEKELKQKLAKKKAELKRLQEQKKKDEAKRKAEAKKKALAAKNKKAKAAVPVAKKAVDSKPEPEIPQDTGAMKAYSQAVAQAAETNEPDEPVNYGTLAEKDEQQVEPQQDDGSEQLNSLINKMSHQQTASMFPGKMLQLSKEVAHNAALSQDNVELVQISGLESLLDDATVMEIEGADDTTAAQTDAQDQTVSDSSETPADPEP
mmetsp:Transcript_36828/g.56383  ORF Transcript_36828/g.56383 Transcript_36828/m.56383 type:complete len:249 (+) Transcript_36828:177-923(+)